MPFVSNQILVRITQLRNAVQTEAGSDPNGAVVWAGLTEYDTALAEVQSASTAQYAAGLPSVAENNARIVDIDTFELGLLEARNDVTHTWSTLEDAVNVLRDWVIGRGA